MGNPVSSIVPNHQTHSRRIGKAITPYLFIAPFGILLLTFNLFVFAKGAYTSLTDAQSINPGSWIGFQNYQEVIGNARFWQSLGITLHYTLGSLATQIPVAFMLAVILNGIAKRYRGALRAAFYVPALINSVVVALIFRVLFNKDFGAINWVLGLLHLPNHTNWLNESTFSVPLMIAVSFWQWTGFHMVYFLSQLQTITPTIYEVAKLDGASRTRTLFAITVPLMRPAFTFVLITSAIGCLMLFDLPFMLFPNSAPYGPGQAARTLVAFIYDYGFGQQFQVGYATAAGWLVFCIIMVVSLFQLRLFGLERNDD